MDDPSRQPESASENTGGLYKNVNVPVKTVNIAVIALLAIVVVLTLVGQANGGFTVRFDSRGGSDVAAQKLEYGALIEEPEPPTREGFEFSGWYIDSNCYDLWDFSSQTVSDNVTLYAGWTERSGQ